MKDSREVLIIRASMPICLYPLIRDEIVIPVIIHPSERNFPTPGSNRKAAKRRGK